jgi:hypothetical protein
MMNDAFIVHHSQIVIWSGSVSRILFRLPTCSSSVATRAQSGVSDGHSSRRRIAPLARATYPEVVTRQARFGRAVLVTPPYLVLHHEEFA